MLGDAGLRLEEKKDFQEKRNGWVRFETSSQKERQVLIDSNSQYGHMVCRCEKVTEAEIREAIARGADTMDAVKHLTRAGMGRCQGGFYGISVQQEAEHARGNRAFNPYFPLVGPRPWAGPVFIIAGVVFLLVALLE